jgi:hypothetical protein
MKRFKHVKATILIAFLVFQSCNILEPREAQPPEQGQDPLWIVPNNPKDVFLNLKVGFASTKDSNYDRSLDPTFVFVPRDGDVAQFPPAVFQNWTKEVELQVLRTIKGTFPSSRAIQFGTGPDMIFTKEDIEVGRAYFEGPYMILLRASPLPAPVDTFAGIARFTVVQGSQGWVLTAWQDLDLSGGYPTSSWLRGTYRASGG